MVRIIAILAIILLFSTKTDKMYYFFKISNIFSLLFTYFYLYLHLNRLIIN